MQFLFPLLFLSFIASYLPQSLFLKSRLKLAGIPRRVLEQKSHRQGRVQFKEELCRILFRLLIMVKTMVISNMEYYNHISIAKIRLLLKQALSYSVITIIKANS